MFSHGKGGAKFGPGRRPIVNQALRIEKQEVTEALQIRFREVANNNAKLLALLGDVGPETSKNWLEGRNLPALSTFINMARQSPELRAAAIQLMDPEAEFDPEWQLACLRLAQAAQRKLDRA